MKIKTKNIVEPVDKQVEPCTKKMFTPIEAQKSVRTVREADFALFLDAARAGRLPRSMTVYLAGNHPVSNVDANALALQAEAGIAADGVTTRDWQSILATLYRACWGEGGSE